MSKANGKSKPAAVHALRIPPALADKVMAKVKRTGKTKSQVLVLAITRGLGGVQ